VKTDHRKPTTGRQLESLVTTAVVTSGDASAPEMARAGTVMAGVSTSKRWLVARSFDVVGHRVRKQGRRLGFDI
jgi:hypothetical protein